MSHEYAPLGDFNDLARYLRKSRGTLQHVIGDAGELGDLIGQRPSRMYQSFEAIDDLCAIVYGNGYLYYFVALDLTACGLNVDNSISSFHQALKLKKYIMCSRLLVPLLAALSISCSSPQAQQHESEGQTPPVMPGGWRVPELVAKIDGRSVALVVNHTSTLGQVHLVDTLRALGVLVQRILSPEHGFRGTADAGAHVSDEVDGHTGIPIVSLYGPRRKPLPKDWDGVDLVIFDIQDVGTRFYTYISTLHYVMESCAENGKPVLLLDRPNPNGHYVDGPVLEPRFKSFVGMHQVPIVYGMTIGEYGLMINGEGWLEGGMTCQLEVLPCLHYDHQTMYDLPVPPSPNLPNLRSVLLYPSLCFFEGTPVSIGRGTTKQFQVIGHPDLKSLEYTFTPDSMYGAADPPQKGQLCHGFDLTSLDPAHIFAERAINLDYLITTFMLFEEKEHFFNENGWIDRLAGTTTLRASIENGWTAKAIKESWQPGIEAFMEIRQRYLLYP